MTTKPSIEQQKSELSVFAIEFLTKGINSDQVYENLKNVVYNSNYSREINVDAIVYLAKCKLGLIK